MKSLEFYLKKCDDLPSIRKTYYVVEPFLFLVDSTIERKTINNGNPYEYNA